MRHSLLLLLVALCSHSAAQTPTVAGITGVAVEYKRTYNGKPSGETINLMADARNSATKIGQEWIFMDYIDSKILNMSILPSGDSITTSRNFTINKGLEVVGSEVIAGWECTKYRTIVNSNTIEIWSTEDIGFNATFQPESGVPRGVVLKTVRNGNSVIEAITVSRTRHKLGDIIPRVPGKLVDAAQYRYIINNKDVITIPIFSDVSIGFNGAKGPESFTGASPDSIFSVAGGSVVLRKVVLPANIESKSIFARVVQRAEKDAYDRTGSIFVIPVGKERSFLDAMSTASSVKALPAFVAKAKGEPADLYPGLISTANYDVPLELMRFFTSFGVGGYNHIRVHAEQWADSVIYEQEITHFAPHLAGEVWIGAYIGNWVDRGHRLSLTLTYHPSGGRGKDGSRSVVMPLFNTVNLLEQAGQRYPVFFDKVPLSVTFRLDKDLIDARLVYTSTGHGGWGTGDEFNPKLNTIHLNNKMVYNYFPWRDDCASYRSLNPASGNFSNGLSSSDLSRSAWCPGTITNPVYIPLGNMKKGMHTIKISIPQGAPEGSSFSYWCVSGTLTGDVR